MIAAAVVLFADVALSAAVMSSDDALVTAAAWLFDAEQAFVTAFDDLMPLTAAAVVEVFVEGHVDPGETWFLLFLVCRS